MRRFEFPIRSIRTAKLVLSMPTFLPSCAREVRKVVVVILVVRKGFCLLLRCYLSASD
jgi:hypothetical protein